MIRVIPPSPFLDLSFVFSNGGAVLVPPITLVQVIQGNWLSAANVLDGDRTFSLVGFAAKTDPAAALTGATFTMQFASGISAGSAPWAAVTGTIPAIPVGDSGVELNSNAPTWTIALPAPFRDNSCFAVTLATCPANAVCVAVSLVVEYA